MKDFETELKTLIGFVARTSPLKNEFTQDYIDGLVWGLQGYTIEQIKSAMLVHMRKSRFLPAICDIVEIIDGSKKEERANIRIEAEEQAMEVWERLCCRGGIGLEMTDRAMATLETLGGWDANGQTLESDAKWWRKNFVEMYEAMTDSKKTEILQRIEHKTKRNSEAISMNDLAKLPFTDWTEQ